MATTALPSELTTRILRQVALGAGLLGLLGVGALGLGLREAAPALWGFGAACLLHVPMTLAAGRRVREGLGNRGLDGELRTLRAMSWAQRALAVGWLVAAGADLWELRGPGSGGLSQGLALVAVLTLGALAWVKGNLAEHHPTLAQDARQTRALLVLAGLLAGACFAGGWVPWLGSAVAVAMGAWLFGGAHVLARALAVKARGCGGGCSCG